MPTMNELTLPPGYVFREGYEIIAELGTGSFGRVYKARQLSTGQDVAVKVLRFDAQTAGQTGKHRERFQREMRLCAALSHPNIVRLIDSGETGEGVLYAIFEFVPGKTLERVLAEEGKLRLREAARLMSQVLDALSCAHAAGVIHRDLKPGNIMVTKTGVLRNALVLDFGLSGFARELHGWSLPRLTATYEMMGTPGYAAPEQLRGENASPQSDVYSWAVTFLECVTGELAVGGTAGYEVIFNQLGPEPVRIPDWLRRERIGQLLEVATAKAVDRRTVAAEALLEALGGIDVEDPEEAASSERAELPHGERRQLTVVSCRSTFTPPDDTAADIEELDQLFQAQHQSFAETAERHGGHMASVQTDRALLVFGYPHAREDDARRAARAALAIADEGRRAGDGAAEPRLRLDVHVGVHTGLVIARELRGSSGRTLHDVVGLTPQVSAALDAIAGAGEVLASADTQRLIRHDIIGEPAGEHPLPGSSRAMPVFRLTRVARESGSDVLVAPETPLVGRADQLTQLVHAWEDAQAGRSGAILISGEAGIGKSRMLQELRRRVPADAWLEARCVEEAQNSPLRPIIETLAILGRDSVSAFLARYEMDDEMVPLFASLLASASASRQLAVELPPDRHHEVTLNAIVKLVFKIAASRPIVLAIEDLHWADPSTLALASLLIQELQTAHLDGDAAPHIYVAFTARPDFTPPWQVGQTSLMHVGRLASEHVEEIVTRILAPTTPLPRTLLDAMVQHADGVPLFVEEMARALLESGARKGGAFAAEAAALAIPPTLRDLLAARLDRLSAQARETAQLAAVLGREFQWMLLRAASPHDETALRAELAELGDAGLVNRRRSAAGETYVFKHALVRDSAYQSLVRSTRSALHARVADMLRRQFPAIESTRPDIVAHHAEAGGRTAAAIDYWKRAGDVAMRRGAYVESLRLFERGTALLASVPPSRQRLQQEIGLTESSGAALLATQGYAAPEVERRFARALELCRELGGDVPLKVLYGIWVMHVTRSDREATAALLPQLAAHAERARDPVALYTAHTAAAIRAFATGAFERARDEASRAVQWYDADELRAFVREYGYDGRLHTHGWLMWSLSVLGDLEGAARVRDQMMALSQQSGNPYAIALALSFAAGIAHDHGDRDAALQYADACIELATEHKLYFWLATATCVRGWALAAGGDVDGGIAHITQGLGILEAIGIRITYGYYLSFLAEAHLARGDAEAGLAVVDQALALCATLLDTFYEPELHRLRGELELARGRVADGERWLTRAVEASRACGAKSFELNASMRLARLWHPGAATESPRGVPSSG